MGGGLIAVALRGGLEGEQRWTVGAAVWDGVEGAMRGGVDGDEVVSAGHAQLSVGVAVLRHRLDGVEVAVRRSLVYGRLLAAGLAAYAGVLLLLDAVLRGHADVTATGSMPPSSTLAA